MRVGLHALGIGTGARPEVIRAVAAAAEAAGFATLWAEEFAVAERVAALAEQCQRRGRSLRELSVAVALADGSPGYSPSSPGSA
jgi:alkanesulfonate monooxygenase SsuD/methylene tetrahydromethanopterin reductase-like flavin-dependent oxidoreductase (luciferase family)